MTEGQITAWYVVLGSILAVIGGVITQIVLVKWVDIRTRKMLVILLKDVIAQMNIIIEKLLEAHKNTGMVYVQYLITLRNSRVTFDRNREYVIRLSDVELRKEILSYFDRASLSDMTLAALQNIKNQPNLGMPVDRPIKDETENLRRIKGVGESILEKLKKL